MIFIALLLLWTAVPALPSVLNQALEGPQAALAAQPPAVVLDELRAEIAARFPVVAFELQSLRMPPAAGGSISLSLAGLPCRLVLFQTSLRAPAFRVLVQDATGAVTETPSPPITTYRGWVEGLPDAQAAASIIENRLHAILYSAGDVWVIEPADRVTPRASPDLCIVYRAADAIDDGSAVCGVEDALPLSVPVAAPPNGPPQYFGGGGRAEIAFEADFEFFQINGSSVATTVADIELVLNQVALIYQSQVGICYANTGIIVRTGEPDPYTATDAGTLLCQFRDHWNGGVGIPRDVAHLMTGKNLDGNTIGLAYIGVLCFTNDAACNGGSVNYGLSQSRYSHPSPTPLANRVNLTAHELGHNWNACHCNQTSCESCPNLPDCGIMKSSVSSSLTFEPCSANVIMTHRNSRSCLDGCLNPIYVDFRNDSGDEEGTSENPFPTVSKGVLFIPVTGSLIIANGNYGETLTIYKPMTLNATGGAVRIGP